MTFRRSLIIWSTYPDSPATTLNSYSSPPILSKIIFLENKDISIGKAYHNTFSICQRAKKTMLEIFNKENSKFKIKVHFIEIEKINAGMSLALAGKNEYNERKLKEVSEIVIKKCL